MAAREQAKNQKEAVKRAINFAKYMDEQTCTKYLSRQGRCALHQAQRFKTSDLGPEKPKPLETLGNPNTEILTIRNYWRWRAEIVVVSVSVPGKARSYTSEGNARTCPRSPKTIGLAFLAPSHQQTDEDSTSRYNLVIGAIAGRNSYNFSIVDYNGL